jgi:predicted component of type VI protein secretion system
MASMAKLIITHADGNQREIQLHKERLTIGRASHNDVVIDHPTVSSEHAVIVALQNEPFLEDLGSTNGTKVNGQPVKKHFLQDGDVVQLAAYRMKFCADGSAREEIDVDLNTSSMQPAPVQDDQIDVPELSMSNPVARVRFLSGRHAGKLLILTKSLTTIGRPGDTVAGIVFNAQAYYLTHIEGATLPTVNGRAIKAGGLRRLLHGDVIELPEAKIEFLLTK